MLNYKHINTEFWMLTNRCNYQKPKSLSLAVFRKPFWQLPCGFQFAGVSLRPLLVLPRHKKCDSRSTWQSGVLHSGFCQTLRADQFNTLVQTYLAFALRIAGPKSKVYGPSAV